MNTTVQAILNLIAVLTGSAPTVVLQTVDALKQLYAALGGNPADVFNISKIPDMVNKLADFTRDVNYKSMFEGLIDGTIETLIIPEGVETIATRGNVAGRDIGPFANLTNIKNVILPKSLKTIGNGAFYGCSNLTNIVIPNGVTSIGDYAFYGCTRLVSIEIPSSVTNIGNYAFYECESLARIKIPSGVTSIGNNAFNGCSSLASIELPSGLTSIGSNAFQACKSLTSVEIPAGVTSIGSSAFFNCTNLASLVMKASPTTMGTDNTTANNKPFYGCAALKNITFTEGVTAIKRYAFYGSITNAEAVVTILASAPTIGENAFNGMVAGSEIRCAFAEGAVSGAPWGATNATITYDYTPPEEAA